MDYGTLRVTTPDGQVREYPIDVQTAIVGRAGGNRVVIDHVSVSRRHANLIVEDGKVMLEDLGSASGTYLGSQRLAPNAPALVSEGQAVRFGDVEAVFFFGADARTSAPTASFEESESPLVGGVAVGGDPAQTISVSLASPGAPVAAGSPTTATVAVQNRGPVTDEITITVPDLPADWVKVSRPVLSLVPHARDEVTIVIQPPRSAEAAAREYAFSVAVVSKETGGEVRALGKVTVLPFEGFKISLEPPRSDANFTVTAENNGNVPVAFTLAGSHADNALDFDFAETSVSLEPGQRTQIRLKVTPKTKKNFGAQQIDAFRIEATSEGSGPKSSADGQLRVTPPLQKWKMPALLLCMLVLLGGLGFAATKIDFGSIGGGSKATPTVVAGASTTAEASAVAKPTVITKGGKAVVINSDPNPPANDNCLAVRSGDTPNKSSSANILGRLCSGTVVEVKDGPMTFDGIIWWKIEGKAADNKVLTGWAAEKNVDGTGTPFLQYTP